MKTIRRLNGDGAPFSGEFHPDALSAPWKALEEWEIALYPWDGEGGYRPRACARVGVRRGGLCVLMYALEPVIQARETQCGGMVCVDSCLEFFFQPFADDPRYVNCEANPLGTLHIGIGEGRGKRAVLRELPEGISPIASEHRGAWWAVYYEIPASFLLEHFQRPLGSSLRANLYTCDESVHPHFGTLFPVTAPKPDFHRPECFCEIAIEGAQ